MPRLFTIAFLLVFAFHTSIAQTPKQSANDPASQLKAYTEQAQQLLARQQPDSAWQQALKPGIPLLKSVPDTALVGRAFRVEVVTFYHRQHELTEAIGLAKNLIQWCRQANDPAMEGQTRQLLVMAFSDLGMYQECISELLQNISLFEKLKNLEMMAKTYNYLAWAYQQRGDVAQWERCTRLAIQYGKQVNKPQTRAVSFLNEGNLYLHKKQFAKAVQTFQTILPEIESNATLHRYIPDAYRVLAEGLRQDGQFSEALRIANIGLEKCLQYGNPMAEIANYLTISKTYAALHNNKASLEAATHALSLTTQNLPPIARQEALQVVSEAQERMGNPAAALKTTRQLAALTDSLNQINKAEAIATAETRFNVKAKNATIDLLNKNMVLRQQQAQQEKQTALIVIVSLILGFLTVGFFWYRARKTSRLLQRQKAEIEAQARQLAEINGIKDQLFSIVSHDLRGPVMSLQQGLDRLESATQPSADALPRFRQSVNAVAALTDNVLCWSLAQMGGLRTHPQPFGVVEVVEDVLTLYTPAIAQKNLRVVISPDLQRAASILADENQAEIVLRNIIQNAIQFSPVGGELRFEVEQQGDSQSLLVIDEGPGFEGQLSSGPQTKTSTGLGLQVVGDLMSRNGGSATFALRTDRSGTVVRLRWPSPHTIESGTALVGQPEKSVI